MWSTDDVIPFEANNNINIDINSNNNTVNNIALCTETLISNLMKNDVCYKGNTSPQDQHSNNSSLESLNSPLIDDNQVVSTSCSEDSFEMSSTTSRTANDLPTPSDHSSYPFLSSDSMKRATPDNGHDVVDNNEEYESIDKTDLKTESDVTENNHSQPISSAESHQTIIPNRSNQSVEPCELKSSEVGQTLIMTQNKILEGKCESINANESVDVDVNTNAKAVFEDDVNHKNESQIQFVPKVNEVNKRTEKSQLIEASVEDIFVGVSSNEGCSSSEVASELPETLPNDDQTNLSAISSPIKTSSGDHHSYESDCPHSAIGKEHNKDVALASASSTEMLSTNEVPSSSAIPSSTKEIGEQKSSTMNSSESDLFNRLDEYNWRVPSTSKSMGCISNKEALQKSIDAELNSLDTCLPNLDFKKLEQQLHSAARERLIIERKLLGEQVVQEVKLLNMINLKVRRRLALQVDQLTAGPSPRVLTRPSKSNLGFRLKTAMNLQVCYMNDIEDDEDADSDSSSDDDFGVPKSKSAPNLRGHVHDGSSMNASQLRKQIASNQPNERRLVLENETKLMLAKAKQTAKMQMELEKLYAPRSSKLPKKVTRIQLSKMSCRQLMEIYDQLSKRIDVENAELMRLLVERDSLHMQQDSMLVDIEDMIR
ncbi:unnamed protein product [Anisakis simplex]|uniref:SCHIP-1 domain-containing protein n=1 Tax=Anisakis simplex TaxID=6269 RepID=A0A0M3K0P1_ANISI|nr:unnamed protein product [Anisakis simplex]